MSLESLTLELDEINRKLHKHHIDVNSGDFDKLPRSERREIKRAVDKLNSRSASIHAEVDKRILGL